MKKNLLTLIPLLLVGMASAADYPPITLEGTEVRPLTSEINQRPYQLLISYPYSYSTQPEKRYPVVYVLDGYWDVKLINSIYGNMIYDKTVPEFITVGIGYADPEMDPGQERMWDMTPKAISNGQMNTGGGDDFFAFIKTEVIPYIDREFRTDTEYRVLGGSSLGGFFTLYTMLTEPELFDAYIAISPATGIAHRWLFTYESQYRLKDWSTRNHARLPARLFMSGAEKEWTGFFGEILAFNEILKHGEYEDFVYRFRLVDDEKHAGTKGEGYSRGIRYALQPYLDQVGTE